MFIFKNIKVKTFLVALAFLSESSKLLSSPSPLPMIKEDDVTGGSIKSKKLLEDYVSTNAGKLFYRDTGGDGPILVLLHGSSTSSFIFTKFMEQALTHSLSLRIIAFDSPGHGKSEDFKDPNKSYTHIGCARIFLEALEKLGVSKFSVYGWSKGGHEAINMLGLAEEKMESLIIDGTPPLPTEVDTIFSKAFRPIPEIALLGKNELLSEEEAHQFVSCQGFDVQSVPFMLYEAMHTIGNARAWPFQSIINGGERVLDLDIFKKARIPILITGGKDDCGINYQYVSGLMKEFPSNISMELVEGPHGHLWINPDQFYFLLIKFLGIVYPQLGGNINSPSLSN